MDEDILLYVYAVPFFILLILAEWLYGLKKGKNTYEAADTLNSLSTGLIMLLSNTFSKAVPAGVYILLLQNASLLTLPSTFGAKVVIIGLYFVLTDFCYYWFHRIAHEVNFLWGSHEPHHQSEHFNLSTALRQGAFQGWFSWVFYLPLAFLGCPFEVYLSLNAFNTLYQFWIHTEHLKNLGWFEKIFVTPSHHRVHHARNPQYLDKNHGGTFIIWDKLFGTFEPEVERPLYGTTIGLKSLNPLWANLAWWNLLFTQAIKTRKWQDKLRLWGMPTGWCPEDSGINTEHQSFTRPELSLFMHIGLFLYMALMIAATLWVLANANQAGPLNNFIGVGFVLLGLWLLGALLERLCNGKEEKTVGLEEH